MEKLPTTTTFADLTSPLPIEQEDALEHLQIYAEKELLSCHCIPALCTDTQDFEREVVSKVKGKFNKNEFLEYQHETGEIYWLRSTKESIAVLNVDWMINLLKQVYHHEFDKKLLRKEIDFENVCEEMIEDCSFMRKNCGLISESILSHCGNATTTMQKSSNSSRSSI